MGLFFVVVVVVISQVSACGEKSELSYGRTAG